MINNHEYPRSLEKIAEATFGSSHVLNGNIDDSEPLAIFPSRFSGEQIHVITEDSRIGKAAQSIPTLFRLNYIGQLGHLRLVGDDPENSRDLSLFHHTRYLHTLQTAEIVEHILSHNDFPDQDIQTTVIASLLHDIATPAGGDATKRLDPSALHEEYHWQEMADDEQTIKLFEKHKIVPEQIDTIIKNQGVLGEVLDIADKVAYTIEDISWMGQFPDRTSYLRYHKYKNTRYSASRPIKKRKYSTLSQQELAETIALNPDMGDIVNDIVIQDEKIYFTNPRRLYGLLKARALASKNVYLNPYNQAINMTFENILRPMYARENSINSTFPLTPQSLRNATDDRLIWNINEFWGLDKPYADFRYIFSDFHPQIIRSQSQEEAQEIAEKLHNDPHTTVLGIETIGKIKTGTDWNVKVPSFTLQGKHNGEILPFKEAYPLWANDIDRIAGEIPCTYVAYYQLGESGNNTYFDKLIRKVYGVSNDLS